MKLNRVLKDYYPINLENTIKHIEQIVIEDEQSKYNIHSKLQELIDKSDILKDINLACYTAIQNYRNGDYYEQKNKRIELITKDSYVLAKELLLAVIDLDKPTPIQNVVARLTKLFKGDTVHSNASVAADLLAVCADSGLYDLYGPGIYGESMSIKCLWTMDTETLNFIARTKFKDPMIVKPLDWKSNKLGGYLTTKDGALLGKSKHNLPLALDVLNLLQDVELELDEYVLTLAEISNNPLNTTAKAKAFAQLLTNSNYSYNLIKQSGNSFYFVWQYDFRGRLYSHGYHINLQASKYKKALINTKKKELIV